MVVLLPYCSRKSLAKSGRVRGLRTAPPAPPSPPAPLLTPAPAWGQPAAASAPTGGGLAAGACLFKRPGLCCRGEGGVSVAPQVSVWGREPASKRRGPPLPPPLPPSDQRLLPSPPSRRPTAGRRLASPSAAASDESAAAAAASEHGEFLRAPATDPWVSISSAASRCPRPPPPCPLLPPHWQEPPPPCCLLPRL